MKVSWAQVSNGIQASAFPHAVSNENWFTNSARADL